MTDISEKLRAIDSKIQALTKEKDTSIKQRKIQIGTYAEQLGLLTIPDNVLIGLLLKGKDILEAKGGEREELAANGDKFLQAHKRKNTKANSKNTSQH